MAARTARKLSGALKSHLAARERIQPAHARPLSEDPYAVYLMQLGAERLEVGNRAKKNRVEQRRNRIAAIYNEIVLQPLYAKNKGKLHDLIIAQLEAEKFNLSSNGDPTDRSGASIATLVNRDLPALRKAGRLIR